MLVRKGKIILRNYRELLKIHFGGQANLFASSFRQAKATLSTDKADLPFLTLVKNFLLVAQKQFLEVSYGLITTLFLACLASFAYGSSGNVAVDGSNVLAVHQMGITGDGIKIGMFSARNVRSSHQSYNDENHTNSRVVNLDFSGSGIDYTGGQVPGHDTWCAGIAGGGYFWDGHPDDIGVAPQSLLYCARICNDSEQFTETIFRTTIANLVENQGCTIIFAPIAWDGVSDGNSVYSKIIDYYAYANPFAVFATASGNKSANVNIFGDSFNSITTAALIDPVVGLYNQVGGYSNPGPTINGRHKPEISAPGSRQTTPSIGSDTSSYTTVLDGATSFSLPQTAGVVALMQDFIANGPNIDPEAARNVVIKAVMVNTTFPNINGKYGVVTYPADPNNTWHPERGYGRIDAYRAVQTLAGQKIQSGDTTTATCGWGYATSGNGDMHDYSFTAEKNSRLIFTVTWNRAVSKIGNSFIDEMPPKFNLNVVLRDSIGNVMVSFCDTPDNLEKIDVLLPANDIYTVELHNTSYKSRAYGIAFEVLPPLTGDYNVDYIVDVFDLNYIAGSWLTGIGEDKIDMSDLANFAAGWTNVDDMYYNE